jgi:hypothetical protein
MLAHGAVEPSHLQKKRDMLSGGSGRPRCQKTALIVITSAIKTAFIDHPGSGHGTTWDQVAKSDEESIHLAKAGPADLRKAGYSVARVEGQNAPKP